MPSVFPNIEELYDQYSKRLFFTSLRIVASSFDAEEIMHDTFIRYYYYPKKEKIEKIESWLAMVCIRKSIDILRERKREHSFLDEMKSPLDKGKEEANEEVIIENTDEHILQIENIKQGIQQLPDGYRLILSLHLFEGYDYSEIAQITQIKENTIRSQYMRAKNKLLEIIQHK